MSDRIFKADVTTVKGESDVTVKIVANKTEEVLNDLASVVSTTLKGLCTDYNNPVYRNQIKSLLNDLVTKHDNNETGQFKKRFR